MISLCFSSGILQNKLFYLISCSLGGKGTNMTRKVFIQKRNSSKFLTYELGSVSQNEYYHQIFNPEQ